jgi:hypothetical protein
MARASALCMLVVLTASLLTAQKDSESKSAHERLNYFAGSWRVEVHMTAGALDSRTYVSTENNEWAPDHSLLLSKPQGDVALASGVAVMGYSPSKHVYTYHILKSTGDTEDLHGTLEDQTWTWLTEELPSGPQPKKTRITMKQISPTSYALRVETLEGEAWSTVIEGTAKKVLIHSHQDVAFLR